jgi:outer membrane usher protein FimD/PapC
VGAAKVPDATLQGVIGSGVLNGIQQSSASAKFGSNVDIAAEAIAATAEDAKALAMHAQFLAAMARGNSQGTPAAALFQSLSVTTASNKVSLALSIPENVIEQLIEPPKTLRRR